MSISVINKVFDLSPCDGNQLLTQLAIASFINDGRAKKDKDLWAWPSVKTLAKMARISTRQTQRIIASLEEQGELVVERTLGGNNHITNLYRLPNKYLPDKPTK